MAILLCDSAKPLIVLLEANCFGYYHCLWRTYCSSFYSTTLYHACTGSLLGHSQAICCSCWSLILQPCHVLSSTCCFNPHHCPVASRRLQDCSKHYIDYRVVDIYWRRNQISNGPWRKLLWLSRACPTLKHPVKRYLKLHHCQLAHLGNSAMPIGSRCTYWRFPSSALKVTFPFCVLPSVAVDWFDFRTQ